MTRKRTVKLHSGRSRRILRSTKTGLHGYWGHETLWEQLRRENEEGLRDTMGIKDGGVRAGCIEKQRRFIWVTVGLSALRPAFLALARARLFTKV
jgi:hypothetical protein